MATKAPSIDIDQDVAKIKECMAQSIEIRTRENMAAFLKDLGLQLPRLKNQFKFIKGQIEINTRIENGVEFTDIDNPFKSNGASDEALSNVKNSLPGFIASTKVPAHLTTIQFINQGARSLGLEIC
jgi:hypothetical protein